MKLNTKYLIFGEKQWYQKLNKHLSCPIDSHSQFFKDHWATAEITNEDPIKGTFKLRIFTAQNPNNSIPLVDIDEKTATYGDKFQAISVPYEVEFKKEELENVVGLMKRGAALAKVLQKESGEIISNVTQAEKNLDVSVEKTTFKLSKIITHESTIDNTIQPYKTENLTITNTTAKLINTKYPAQPRIDLKNELMQYSQYSQFGVLKPAHTQSLYYNSVTHVRISQKYENVPKYLQNDYKELEYKLTTLSTWINKLPKN